VSLFSSAGGPPAPPPRRREPEWLGPPDEILPGIVPIEAVLAQSATGAVCLSRISAYPTGITFDVVAIQRDSEMDFQPFTVWRYAAGEKEWPRELVRVGVLFPDGRSATNLRDEQVQWRRPKDPVLAECGGGGGGGRWNQGFWLWPLPTDGALTFVCEWPAHGIAEARFAIPSEPIREAAGRAQVVLELDHGDEVPSAEAAE
jgi:hypothetical protein